MTPARYATVCRNMTSTTSLFPHTGRQNLVTVNDATLTTVGRVRANFKVGGCLLSAEFYVIDKITQGVILDKASYWT